ncbi:MAG TPA: aldehyde dehydrogenase family protein, partial [Acidobacteriaceae bacterium]
EARQVEGLLSDNRVAAVTVTGSEAAGRAIAAQAGWLIKKTVLELGGSDPFIVLPSANLDEAVPTAIKARCINNGQSCIAAKRFLVHEDIYDEFEKRFVAGMAALRVGDPTAESTEIGPLATPQIVDDLLAQVSRAKAAGGRVLTGGDRISTIEGGSLGNYFQPTVIAGVLRTAPICQEEIFGPVALLFRIGSVDEAIALANDTPFGLSASVWTTDTAEQNRLAADLQCGGVFFNAAVASDPRLPFGGIKRSGYGRELSTAGMREFLNAKTVVIGGPAIAAQPSLFDQPKAEVRSDKPSEFLQIADQLRRFEPRRPDSRQPDSRQPESRQPEPRRDELPTRRDTFEPRKDTSEPRKDELPTRKDTSEPRKDELPTRKDTPEPRRANQLPPIIFGPTSDDDDDPPPARGSILGLR